MPTAKLPADFVERIKSVTNKRARLVLDRIAQNGSVTTEELRKIGYDHPPRARMDARDLGFPVRTTRVKSSTGKSIAAYSFDLTKKLEPSKAGRAALAKSQRQDIIERAGNKCQLCGAAHDLQIDHRVPYEVVSLFGPAPMRTWSCAVPAIGANRGLANTARTSPAQDRLRYARVATGRTRRRTHTLQ